MAVVVLVRHGRTAANADGILAGWSPGVLLDEHGTAQAQTVGQRLAATPLVAIVSSPLERTQQTADAIGAAQEGAAHEEAARHTEEMLGECHYGAWTGRPLQELAREPLWRDIQERPSTVTFPAHETYAAESLQSMRDRAVAAIERWDARIEGEHGPGAVWAAVSHGDVIKALVSHALASPLDRFQRIVVDPASVSIIRYAPEHPVVLRVNDTGSDPIDLRALSTALQQAAAGDGAAGAATSGGAATSDGTVGGGAGTG